MKKKGGGGGGGGGHDAAGGLRWLLTYADLITLLLVFFIVVALLSSQETTKFREFSEALSEVFNPLWSDKPFAVPGHGTGTNIHSPGSLGSTSRGPIYLMREIERAAQALDLRNIIISREENAVIDFEAEGFFEPGPGARLRPAAREFLDRLAVLLDLTDQNMEVSAHVVAGTPDPWGTTSVRALVVVRYLAETKRIDPARLLATAEGVTVHRMGGERRSVERDGISFRLFGGRDEAPALPSDSLTPRAPHA